MRIINKNIIPFVLLITVLLVQCSTKKIDKRTVFRYNESKGIPSLDPVFAKNQTTIWPVNQLFNGLVQMDDSLNILPCIAKSWSITDSGKVYTFILRSDVYFHNHKIFNGAKGRKVIASDFVYSFKRIVDSKVASPGSWIFSNVLINDTCAGFVAINDSTLKINLKQPFTAFLGILTMQYCSVVPHEIVDFYGSDFRNNPIGTGPFKFKLWKEGEKLILLKNENYFERAKQGNKLPYLDAINISFINDKQSEFLEFIKGNLDFISGVNASFKDELITRNGKMNPKHSDKINMKAMPYLNTEYLAFLLDENSSLVKSSPLRKLAIRQAINYGFDRAKMMTYLRNNIGIPAANGFVPPSLTAKYPEKINGYSYQPDKARELLNNAGYPNGKGLPEITLTTTSDYLDLCEYIQHELQEIGIKIKIEVNTGATFREMTASAKLMFFRASWVADYPDAENYLTLFYSKNFSPSGPNYTHYKNNAYDSLYVKSMNEINDSIRSKYYYQMDKMIIDDAVIVPLYYDEVVRFVQNNIEGFNCNPMNLLNLKKVKKIDY